LNSLSNSINLYFSMIAIPIGLVLNLLTIITFSRQKLRVSSTMSVFYISLAIYDCLSLGNSILFVQMLPSLGVKIVNFSDVLCKLGNVWRKIATQCPSWVQLIMTFDRFRCVVYPRRFKFMENKRKLIALLVSLFFVILLINSAYLGYFIYPQTTTKTQFDPNTNITINKTTFSLNCTASAELALIADVLNVIMRSYLPFSLMLVLNISMTKRFLASKKNSLRNKSLRREYVFTLTVFGINVLFFILYTPWSVYYVLNRVAQSLSSWQTPFITAQLNLFQSIAFCIAYCNNMTLFLINIIFNSSFRREFCLMLCLVKPRSSYFDTSSASAQRGHSHTNLSRTL
jgi:hypothetical protein